MAVVNEKNTLERRLSCPKIKIRNQRRKIRKRKKIRRKNRDN